MYLLFSTIASFYLWQLYVAVRPLWFSDKLPPTISLFDKNLQNTSKTLFYNRFIFEPLQKQTHFHVNEERRTLHNILFKRNCIRISHNWIISGIL